MAWGRKDQKLGRTVPAMTTPHTLVASDHFNDAIEVIVNHVVQ